MPWFSILLFIAQLLLRRFGVMRAQADAHVVCDAEVNRLAAMIATAEPRLKFDCVRGVLPGLLKELGDYLDSTAGDFFGDVERLIDIAVANVTELVKCQLATGGQAVAFVETDLREKVIKCSLSAAVHWFQTRDVAAAISQFFGCMLAGAGGGGGSPSGFRPTPIQRCGGIRASADVAGLR